MQVVDGDNKPTRVGKRVDSEGRNVRVARRTGKDIWHDEFDHRHEASRTPRLKTRYDDEIRAALQEQFGFGNVMQIPRRRQGRRQHGRRRGRA